MSRYSILEQTSQEYRFANPQIGEQGYKPEPGEFGSTEPLNPTQPDKSTVKRDPIYRW